MARSSICSKIGFTREVDDLKEPRQSPLLQPKNLVLRILLRVLSPSILTRVLWSVATSNWWQPSVKTFFFLRAHVIASAYPSSRALCCSAKARKRDQAIVMRQPSEQQSGLNPLKLQCYCRKKYPIPF